MGGYHNLTDTGVAIWASWIVSMCRKILSGSACFVEKLVTLVQINEFLGMLGVNGVIDAKTRKLKRATVKDFMVKYGYSMHIDKSALNIFSGIRNSICHYILSGEVEGNILLLFYRYSSDFELMLSLVNSWVQPSKSGAAIRPMTTLELKSLCSKDIWVDSSQDGLYDVFMHSFKSETSTADALKAIDEIQNKLLNKEDLA